MRIILLGVGPFAVPAFRRVLDDPAHAVVGLVTKPEKPARGKALDETNPVRALCAERGVPTITPENVDDDEPRAQLRAWNADVLLVCDYGKILARETLETARLGGLNLHGSLLPKYRGAAPIQWAMYNGETETGVTVIHMTPRLDAGPCVVQTRTPIDPDETHPELEARLAVLGSDAVAEALRMLDAGPIIAIPQDGEQASKAPRLKKTDGALDWSRKASDLRNQIRAFQPWPKSYTHWLRVGEEPVRIIVDRAAKHDETTAIAALHRAGLAVDVPPGTVVTAYDRELLIRCGRGLLGLEIVQPAGKRAMPIEEFLRGNKIVAGDRFGPA
ncbi:MAG: methionyl-tRNA formyltransferase [Pirellulales bacterium]